MDLSPEDNLRLNVLLSSRPQAIRIDESGMVVYGLTDQGEARVQLNPTCKDELYLRRVRELISGHVLGSPGGYPVYLKRWTRMGQARDQSLEQLLLLGEPEAVVAVVHAAGLTEEQGRRAWWAMPSAENARRMLEKEQVVRGDLGRELAAYLVEYLPFETEPQDIIESVRLSLAPGLLADTQVHDLWRKSHTKTAYRLGFLCALPDALPDPLPDRADWPALAPALQGMAARGNRYAERLAQCLSTPGRTFLRTASDIMRKPANQDVVNRLLDVLADYFSGLGLVDAPESELDGLQADAERLLAGQALDNGSRPDELASVLEQLPQLRGELRAMLILARLGYPVVRPVFSRSTAIGSLMRRKLEPIFDPLQAEIRVLLGAGQPFDGGPRAAGVR